MPVVANLVIECEDEQEAVAFYQALKEGKLRISAAQIRLPNSSEWEFDRYLEYLRAERDRRGG